MYEILSISQAGISKTRAVHQSNLNFHLMNEYLAFLLAQSYLERIENGSDHDMLKLTGKGLHLLNLLDQLEEEVSTFRRAPKLLQLR